MFVFSKIAASWLEFPGLIITACAVFLVLYWRKTPKPVRIFLFSLMAVLYLSSSAVTSRLLVLPLESYPLPNLAEEHLVDADQGWIVVLGGGSDQYVVDPLNPDTRGELSASSLKRLYLAYRLYRLKSYPVLLSGGTVYRGVDERSECELMAQVLRFWGVPEDHIEQEPQSRNTWENARYSLKRLPEGRTTLYLVTSSLHMRRSLLAFQKHLSRSGRGVRIVPVPSDFQAGYGPISWRDFFPADSNFTILASALHEYIGLISYALFYR